MKSEQLQAFINQNIIKKQYANEYRLKRPLKIIVTKSVLDILKGLYKPSYENGGILSGVAAASGVLVIDRIDIVPNRAVVGYSYSPSTVEFNKAIDKVIGEGRLPFAIHTHPLKLNIEYYDSKRAKFYLKPSNPDKAIAREGITDYFNFPESIFTLDSRLENGFGLSFYTGFIFPASITALTTVQIASLGLGAIGLFGNKKLLLGGSIGTFLFEYYRKPKYRNLTNGDYEISLSF